MVEGSLHAAQDVTEVFDLEATALELLRSRLTPGASIKTIKALAGGYTDARVLLCDIAGLPVIGESEPDSGQFVVKIGNATGESQADAHSAFTISLAAFGLAHVPRLRLAEQASGISADVYDIAGDSLVAVRTAEHVSFEDREEVCARVARDLLYAQLDAAGTPDYDVDCGSAAQAWLGPGFPDNTRGNRLHSLLGELGWSGRRFEHEGELLPNPLALLAAASPLRRSPLHSFTGPSHGDLHLRNILARGSLLKQDLDYWVIDVNWPKPAPLLYDQAYLELSAFLSGLTTTTEGRVTPLIAKLENAEVMVPVELGFASTSLVRLVQRIRQETIAVLQEREPRRVDVWNRQLLFAQMAAGLNWASKPLDDPAQRKAAFVWAAWATRRLLRTYEPALLSDVLDQPQSTPSQIGAGLDRAPITATEVLRRWSRFKSANSGMDLFLVCDALESDPRLSVLAHGRWDGVLDFDPLSDERGLSSMVLDQLRYRRHVRRFGSRQQLTNVGRATNWLMANGWNSRDEPSAQSLSEWRMYSYPRRVRDLVDYIYESTANQKAAVLCIRTGTHDEYFDRAIDYIEDAYGEVSLRLDIATGTSTEGVALDAFLRFVTESLPSSGAKLVPALPTKDGRWDIPSSDFRRLSADLEILHTEVLSEESAREAQADPFWRGRPPTWTELEACLDVPRDAHRELIKDLHQGLTNHQLKVVELHHSPGAGGTTLARRVAWDLHPSFPTVVLRDYSDGTVERINEIYQHTGLPVLVIAEVSVLSETDRQELMEGLAQRDSRAVVLSIKRTSVHFGGRGHYVIDPLRGGERERFLEEFQRRAMSNQERALLANLADSRGSIVPHQRLSPFYFGLCLYEEDFEGVGWYVQKHLARMSPRQREAARYLALITRYGQLGISPEVVRAWIGTTLTDDSGQRGLLDVLGPDLRHLVVVDDGTLRLQHPLIAEHVLRDERDDEHRALGLIAVDFIKRLTDVLGPNSHVGLRLLTELFVRRSSPPGQGAQQKSIFSGLIQSMSEEEAVKVFEELTERFPNEPQLWNHRGRYRIYRVRGDFEKAEDDLKKAVEMAHGRDPIHLHTLGMVRRFWVEKITADLLAEHTAESAEQMLAKIEPIYDSAMEAFEQARAIKESEHSWSTPIQLIVTVVDHLVKASGSDSLAEFLESGTPAGRWATDALQRAENYLDGLRNLHPEGMFYRKLTDELDSLYGNIGLLNERASKLRTPSDEDGNLGTLARAVFVRANRDWSRVSKEQLTYIAEMLETRVKNGQASDSDLRLWFQAYRRLPHYSESRAMMLLQGYARRHSLDANYYMYILHFLMWIRGDKQDQERIRYYMEECHNAGVLSRRQWSYEWLGDTSRNPPLVHFSELGERIPGSGFWTIPFSLARVRGIIEDIQSPQAGRIRVSGGRLSAFFTPKVDFLETRDINAPVEFYLGFSYEGLRAWEVTYPDVKPPALTRAERLGPVDRSAQIVHVSAKKAEIPLPARPTRPRIDPRFLASLQHEVQNKAQNGGQINGESTGAESYRDTILRLLMERQEAGQTLSALELGETLQKIYGPASYTAFRAGRKLRAAVEELGFRIVQTPTGFDIGLP